MVRNYPENIELQLRVGGRLTWSWANSVHTDAVANLLVGKTTGEGHNSTLGGSIVEEVWTADVMVD